MFWFSYVCGTMLLVASFITVFLVVESSLNWLKGSGLAFVVYIFSSTVEVNFAHTRI
jgi:hypothetical protein